MILASQGSLDIVGKLATLIIALTMYLYGNTLFANPETERAAFRAYFHAKFPDVKKSDFVNGVYALDKNSREQWIEIEEFPPYEIAMGEGQELFDSTRFANGNTYGDCFGDGLSIRKKYPYFDEERAQVVTMESAINDCREKHGAAPLKYRAGDLAKISAYLSYRSRGEIIDVALSSAGAINAYEKGKKYYYTKRGQLNFACVDCHVSSAGMRLRSEMLSPSLGHVSHFPVYRLKWGSIGTLHRRFNECNKQVRAKPQPGQSEEYRNLEYFLSYMSSGLEFNGPGVRR